MLSCSHVLQACKNSMRASGEKTIMHFFNADFEQLSFYRAFSPATASNLEVCKTNLICL